MVVILNVHYHVLATKGTMILTFHDSCSVCTLQTEFLYSPTGIDLVELYKVWMLYLFELLKDWKSPHVHSH